MSRWTKIVIGALFGIPVLLHLIYSLWASPLTTYYLTVGELYSQETPTGMVRVGGEVMAGSIAWDGSRGELRFVLADGTRQLPVVYPGLALDAFRAGVTAIVEGRLDEEGRFLAQRVLLRCPHKYVDA